MKIRIGDMLTPDVIGVEPETTVADAIDIMQQKSISCVLVLKEGTPLGIFTERNIAQYVVKEGAGFKSRPIKDLMTHPVISVKADTYLYEAYGKLVSHKVRHLVVEDSLGRVVGVITQSNIIDRLGEDYFLDVKKISEIMSRQLLTSSPDAPLISALSEMADRSVSCVVVVDEGRPVGILTERDVGRYLNSRPDFNGVSVGEVMSSPVISVDLATPVYEAARTMREHGVRRLVAVNGKGLIKGVTTQSDIVRTLEKRFVESLREVVREKESELKDTLHDLYTKTIYLDNILRSSIDRGIVATDLNHRIIYFNPAAEHILGYRAEEMIGQDVRKIHFQEDIDIAPFNRVVELIRKGEEHTFVFYRQRNSQQRIIQGRTAGIWDAEDNILGFALFLNDITERKQAEEAIQFMAYHDILTGLPNRVLFNDRLEQEIARSRRSGSRLAVLLMDLDQFKQINDTMGHHAGDILLKKMGKRLSGVLRESDTVSRFGGDEFLMIIPEVYSTSELFIVARKIIEVVEQPILLDGREVIITTSVGIACYPQHGRDQETLIKQADKAMYKAKEQNRCNSKSNISLAAEGSTGMCSPMKLEQQPLQNM